MICPAAPQPLSWNGRSGGPTGQWEGAWEEALSGFHSSSRIKFRIKVKIWVIQVGFWLPPSPCFFRVFYTSPSWAVYMWGRNPPSHKVKGSHPCTAHQPKYDPAVAFDFWPAGAHAGLTGAGDFRGGGWRLGSLSRRPPHSSTCLRNPDCLLALPTTWERCDEQETQRQMPWLGESSRWTSRPAEPERTARIRLVLLQILYRVGSKRAGVTERNEVNQRAIIFVYSWNDVGWGWFSAG